MPSNRPSVRILLHDEQREALDRIAALTGQSRASVVTDFLDPIFQALPALADTMEEAARQKSSIKDAAAAVLTTINGSLMDQTKMPEDIAKEVLDATTRLQEEMMRRDAARGTEAGRGKGTGADRQGRHWPLNA